MKFKFKYIFPAVFWILVVLYHIFCKNWYYCYGIDLSGPTDLLELPTLLLGLLILAINSRALVEFLYPMAGIILILYNTLVFYFFGLVIDKIIIKVTSQKNS